MAQLTGQDGAVLVGEDGMAFVRDWIADTLLSQYANSPILLSLVHTSALAINPAPLIESFFENVWNVDTATGYGLDVWGRIVGVSRILALENGKFWGFDEATTASADPFGQSPFFGLGSATTNFLVSDDVYRRMILAKALSNISRACIPSYNNVLMTLFPNRGNCYVTDPGGMTFALVFNFSLQSYEVAILQQSGILLKPTGVSFTITQNA